MFPADAHKRSSLILLPSALLPASWTVKTADAGRLMVKRVFADPLLLTIEHFLSATECAALVALAEQRGFSRSQTTSGISDRRTSYSSIISKYDSLMQTFMQRVARVVGVPATHFELGGVIRSARSSAVHSQRCELVLCSSVDDCIFCLL